MAKLDKLITYAYFREECDLPQNLPDGELEHKVYRAQEMLRMLLGEDFYIDFLAAYKANTMSSAYQALYTPYVKQFVAWQAHEFWALKANIKINRSGFRVHSEENSVVASDSQMAYVNKDAGYQSQYYKGLMLQFLKKNAADYPLYDVNCGCNTKAGNSFHISAVKNKHKQPQPYGTGRSCKGW